MKALTKYLSNYAEPENLCLDDFPGGFKQGLVIPVYQESTDTLVRFCQFAEANSGTLLILVINRPNSNTDCNWASDFLQPSTTKGAIRWHSPAQLLALHTLKQDSGLLIVDRCVAGAAIPDDQGVGLARKIGADILCALIQQQKVISPWIANTDADATLPTNYFETLTKTVAIPESTKTSAIIFPFEHTFSDDTPPLPTLLYEFSLHYYVAGLHWAGSPYAYQTLGSTLVTHYQHYAKVRGFPKRAGAEDFYLLNKLAKTGTIASLTGTPIKLQARESTRVPFGTGPAVIALASQNDPLLMPIYHPDSFLYLHFFLQLLTTLATEPMTIAQGIDQLSHQNTSTLDLAQLRSCAENLKLGPALEHSYQQGNQTATRLQHLHHWFDSFKTLKFIHHLRDHSLGTISFRHWQDHSTDYKIQVTRPMAKLQQRIKALT